MPWFNNDEDDGDEFGAVPEAWTDEAGNLHHPECDGFLYVDADGYAVGPVEAVDHIICGGCY